MATLGSEKIITIRMSMTEARRILSALEHLAEASDDPKIRELTDTFSGIIHGVEK